MSSKIAEVIEVAVTGSPPKTEKAKAIADRLASQRRHSQELTPDQLKATTERKLKQAEQKRQEIINSKVSKSHEHNERAVDVKNKATAKLSEETAQIAQHCQAKHEHAEMLKQKRLEELERHAKAAEEKLAQVTKAANTPEAKKAKALAEQELLNKVHLTK